MDKTVFLASIPGQATYDFIKALLSDAAYWIGGQRKGGVWSWDDRSEWNLNKWSPGQPSGDGAYIEFHKYHDWNDLGGHHLRKAICQYDLMPGTP